jgi:hypothetical protein
LDAKTLSRKLIIDEFGNRKEAGRAFRSSLLTFVDVPCVRRIKTALLTLFSISFLLSRWQFFLGNPKFAVTFLFDLVKTRVFHVN